MTAPPPFTWTIEVTATPRLVALGFEIGPGLAAIIGENLAGTSGAAEVSACVVLAPDPARVERCRQPQLATE